MSKKESQLSTNKKNIFKVSASPALQELAFKDKEVETKIQQLMSKMLEQWQKQRRHQCRIDMQTGTERWMWHDCFQTEELQNLQEISNSFITVIQTHRQNAYVQKRQNKQYESNLISYLDLPRMSIRIEKLEKNTVESHLFLSCEYWKSKNIKTQAYLNRMLNFLAVTTFVNLTELDICEMEIKNLHCLITLDTPNLQSLSIGSYHLSNIKSLVKYRFPEPMKKFTLGFEFVPMVCQFSRSFERGNRIQQLNTNRESLLNYQYQGMDNANTLNYLVKSCLPSVKQLAFKLQDLPCRFKSSIRVAASEHIGQTVKEKQRSQRKESL